MKRRVAIVQRDIAWQDVAANLAALERMLEGVEADVVVLSEMFQTGFVVNPDGIADDGTTLGWMQRMAAKMDAAVVGSVIVEEQGRLYNRMYFVKTDGSVEYYDKHHLFSVGGEGQNDDKLGICLLDFREGFDSIPVEGVASDKAVGSEEIRDFDIIFFKARNQLIRTVPHSVNNDRSFFFTKHIPHITDTRKIRQFTV